ncbi:MAG: ABC transporter permease [Nitrososphaerales archaeon]
MGFVRRRVIVYIVVLVIVLNLDFILPRLIPGNAAEVISNGSFNAGAQAALKEQAFGLKLPIQVQYFDYLKNMFASWPPTFGISFQYYPETVSNLFASRIGWSLLLIITSLALSLVISYALAAFSSIRRGGAIEAGSLYSSISFQSIPVYWIAMVLLWVFAVDLKWFPIFGNVDANAGTGLSYYYSVIWHGILPVATMTASIFGENYLILRGSAQEVLKSDYVIAARTRGLSDRIVASGYILRNSLLPLFSLLTFSLASLIGREILVEAVFGYNGVGDLIVDSIANRDYPVLEGTLFLVTVLVVIGGLIGDLLLVRLDPRLRRE